MTFLNRWKTDWKLKSLSHEDLFNIIVKAITKELDEVKASDISLESNLISDFDADSVDIVSMLSDLGSVFSKTSSNTSTLVVPTDKVSQIVLVEDLFDIMYEVLLDIETKS